MTQNLFYELADSDMPDIMRSRRIEQEVLDILDDTEAEPRVDGQVTKQGLVVPAIVIM